MRVLMIILSVIVVQACSGKPFAVKPAGSVAEPRINQVYVASHGWHTGFIIPAHESEQQMPFLAERFGDAAYYEFGWGDRGFYQAQEITSGLSLQAIFWPTDSVMHVVAVPYNPYSFFDSSEVIELKLTQPELGSLLAFIDSSFYRDNNNTIISEKQGIYGDSQFYKGEGDYYLFNTCNKWTAKGLASAGFDISTTFKLTAGSIMSFIRAIENERIIIDKR